VGRGKESETSAPLSFSFFFSPRPGENRGERPPRQADVELSAAALLSFSSPPFPSSRTSRWKKKVGGKAWGSSKPVAPVWAIFLFPPPPPLFPAS